MPWTPPKPDGSDRTAVFLRWVWEKLSHELVINGSSTVRVNRGTRGITLSAIASGGGGQPVALKFFQVVSETQSSIECVAPGTDPTTITDTTATTSVLKPKELQNFPGSSTSYGIKENYSPLGIGGGISANKRYAAWDGARLSGSQDGTLSALYKQVIYPEYGSATNDLILAAQIDGNWQDLNIIGRGWRNEVVVCSTYGPEFALIPSSIIYTTPIDFTTL